MIWKGRKAKLWALAAAAVCAVLAMVTARSRPTNIPGEVRNELFNSTANDADLKMENINYVFNRDGKDEWILKAKLARHFKRREILYLDEVTANFFSKDQKTVLLSGDHGTYFTKSKDISLAGNVSAVSSSEEKFYSNSITYKESSRLLSTSDDVTIINGGIRVDGKGLIYDMATGRMSVMNNVKVSSDKMVSVQ